MVGRPAWHIGPGDLLAVDVHDAAIVAEDVNADVVNLPETRNGEILAEVAGEDFVVVGVVLVEGRCALPRCVAVTQRPGALKPAGVALVVLRLPPPKPVIVCRRFSPRLILGEIIV